MEPNASVPSPGTSLFEMDIDEIGQSHLNNISKWGKFVAVTLLIITGLGSLLLATQFNKVAANIAELFSFDYNQAGIVLAVCFIFAALALLCLVLLLRACILIKRGIIAKDIDRIAEGFKALKGVFTISIIFSSLSILGAITSLTRL
jgi:hypothetical protein